MNPFFTYLDDECLEHYLDGDRAYLHLIRSYCDTEEYRQEFNDNHAFDVETDLDDLSACWHEVDDA